MDGEAQPLIILYAVNCNVEAGERLASLPPDMRETVAPSLRPHYDALYDAQPPQKLERPS